MSVTGAIVILQLGQVLLGRLQARLGCRQVGAGGGDLFRSGAGLQLVELRLGNRAGGLRALQLQHQLGGVQPGQCLAGLDPVTRLDEHLRHPAADAKSVRHLRMGHDTPDRGDGADQRAPLYRDNLILNRPPIARPRATTNHLDGDQHHDQGDHPRFCPSRFHWLPPHCGLESSTTGAQD